MSHLWPKPDKKKRLNIRYLFMRAAEVQLNGRMQTIADSLLAEDDLPTMLKRINGMTVTDDGLQIDATLIEPDALFDLRGRFVQDLARLIEHVYPETIVTTDRWSLTVTRIKEFNGYQPERERPVYTKFKGSGGGRPRAGAVTVTIDEDD